ncbi:hypothetical protein [Crocosphaera sp.]|uniref:lipase family alpha/beta hydrolase n=1 Tax=Crocosphaera sp. TaxID=2729996 RepID=UPI00260F9653|nr:hypothetical protein [Crocosphaera sp.]MDJ0582806.1 hypothetical protein [Crocosphaera sp.]
MVTASSTDSSRLVFFVPGIMGSSLFLNRKTAFGTSQTEQIWGNDFQENVRLFHLHPEYLNPINPHDIQAGEVIRYFNNIRFPQRLLSLIPVPVNRVIVYQSLMDFCTQETGLNLTEGTNFFPFAYNWLADNRETADQLAAYIREKDKDKNCRFCFVGHSMGGIIIRLMLLNNDDIAEKTDLFFQIASPIQGSAKAYFGIRRYPQLDPIFDRVWRWFQRAETMGALQRAIERCYSLYQLLPAPEIITLYDEGGTGYSPLDKRLWNPDLHQYINAAIDVHKQLAQSAKLDINIKCVYSNQKPTIIHYIIRPDNFDIIRPIPPSILGDNTVTVASAIAYSQEDTRILINTPPGDHMGICQNQQVYNELTNAWNSL